MIGTNNGKHMQVANVDFYVTSDSDTNVSDGRYFGTSVALHDPGSTPIWSTVLVIRNAEEICNGANPRRETHCGHATYWALLDEGADYEYIAKNVTSILNNMSRPDDVATVVKDACTASGAPAPERLDWV